MTSVVVPESPARTRWARRIHPPPLAGVVAVAWALLVGAQLTGSGDLMDHDAILDSGGAPDLTGLLLFVVGWSVMVVAMMIPATWPVLGRRSAADAEAGPSPAGFLLGFVLVWGAVGLAALAFDSSVHRAVHGIPALESRPGLVLAAVLAFAGLVQLLPSTVRHLTRAITPPTVEPGRTTAGLSAGRDHGLRCLRADGPLMLVMFATGGALAWMAVLTVVMAAERVVRWGSAVAVAAGAVLVGAAILTALLSA